jgi:hypothetical protein
MQKSVINQSQFYKIISVNFFKKSFILILLGLPLFYFYRIFFTSKMEEELLKIT